MRPVLAVLLALLAPLPALAEPYVVTDSRKNKIVFPQGPASFADEVVEHRPGNPAPKKSGRDPKAVLGVPDRQARKDEAALTLGVGGQVVVRFTDNVLVDLPGPDLYIFEVGPDVEATTVEVSVDGTTWVAVGRADGSLSQVDLAGKAPPGEAWRYVRLTDDPAQGGKSGRWPGADIDAIGAIGTMEVRQLSGEVLFDFDSDRLRPEADPLLTDLASSIEQQNPSFVMVEGHTDNQGTADYNRDLSLRRARSVADRLAELGVVRGARILIVKGYGSERPVASNATEEGRRQNRRVEVVLGPPAP